MARNQNNDNNNSSNSLPYVIAAIALAVIMIINMFLVVLLYQRAAITTSSTSRAQTGTSRILSQLNEANLKVLQIVSGASDRETTLGSIMEYNFPAIMAAEGMAGDYSQLTEEGYSRYSKAKQLVNAYFTNYAPLAQKWINDPTVTQSSMTIDYNEKLYSYYISASEMLKSASDIVQGRVYDLRDDGGRLFRIIEIIMFTMLLLSEVGIFLAAKMAKKSKEAIEESEKNLAETGAKLQHSRQQTKELARTNLITGMKNRYSLDEDISKRLETDRFNIAVFDMDNFRSINDTYGYDFGDEYLILLADQLKEQFSSFAEIYNITGNEFCFLFNRDISENQAMAHAQKIQAVMSSPYNVMNLTVQLPCSGAVYHYLPGDCLNVNSLLVKLDTAMRSVKMNGGNMITSVMNI